MGAEAGDKVELKGSSTDRVKPDEGRTLRSSTLT